MYRREQLDTMPYMSPGVDGKRRRASRPLLYNKRLYKNAAVVKRAQELRSKYRDPATTLDEKLEIIDEMGLGNL